jgi:hypothetical protein
MELKPLGRAAGNGSGRLRPGQPAPHLLTGRCPAHGGPLRDARPCPRDSAGAEDQVIDGYGGTRPTGRILKETS